MINWFKNLNNKGYKYHKDVCIIACYYNPLKNPLRKECFDRWYDSIKHLEHRIIELAIGNDDFQIPENKFIERIRSKHNLWYKEQLLNILINKLPEKYKYVFWMDTDIELTNKNWILDSVKLFEKGINVIQPFSICKHLTPESPYLDIKYFDDLSSELSDDKIKRIAKDNKIWRSFSYNASKVGLKRISSNDYDLHGHVGFIWGARLDNLRICDLYEKSLTGGADHIIAHATVGQFNEKDINEVYKDDLVNVLNFMKTWWTVHYGSIEPLGAFRGSLGCVNGELYHHYHGDLDKRDYYNRIKNFTLMSTEIKEKDDNGLFIPTQEATEFYSNYYENRETIIELSFENKEINNTFEFGNGDFGGGGAEGDLNFS